MDGQSNPSPKSYSKWQSVVFGIFAPLACLAIDLTTEFGYLFVKPLLYMRAYWLFCYGLIGLELIALVVWIRFGGRLGAWSAVVAGVLAAGAAYASLLGCLLIPYSTVGFDLRIGLAAPILALVGSIGLIPFITAYTYSKNSVLAYKSATNYLVGPALWGATLAGIVLAIGLPGSSQACVWFSLRSAIQGVAQGEPASMHKLRVWYRFAGVPESYSDNPDNRESFDPLENAYARESDPLRKQRIADAFEALGGNRANLQ